MTSNSSLPVFNLQNKISLTSKFFPYNKVLNSQNKTHFLDLSGYTFKVKELLDQNDKVYAYSLIPSKGSEPLRKEMLKIENFIKDELDETPIELESISLFMTNFMLLDPSYDLEDGSLITVDKGRAFASIIQKGRFISRFTLSKFSPFEYSPHLPKPSLKRS